MIRRWLELRGAGVVSVLLYFAPTVARAEAPSTPTTSLTSHIASRLDPTDFRSRFEIRNRYQSPQSGGYRNLFTARMDYAFSKSFSMRFELPYVHSDPEKHLTPADTGIGDLAVRATYRALRTPKMALVVGTELISDTAESFALGAGKYTVAPIVFASFEVPALHSTFFPTLQYFHSLGGDSHRVDVDYTSAKVFTLTRWPASFYTGTEAVVFFDHARNNRVGATLEVETGRFLSPHIAVWIRPGIGLYGDDIPQVYKWNFELGFRYLFD